MEIGVGFIYSLGKDLFSFFWKKLYRGDFKKTNYKITKRETDYVIYADGTVILHMIYEIEMKQDGDFEIDKYYECVNENTTITINKIYNNFYCTHHKHKVNRFKNNVLVIELESPPIRKESIFTSRIKNKSKNRDTNKDKIDYAIKYTNLKKRDKFRFCISLTIPKEFAVSNGRLSVNEDRMIIEYDYELYIFRTKIDKQHILAESFSPACYLQDKKIEPSSCTNIYYNCFEWKFKKPPKGEIIIKFNQ